MLAFYHLLHLQNIFPFKLKESKGRKTLLRELAPSVVLSGVVA